MEGINGMTANQMALHTNAGCNATSGASYSGTIGATNCNATSGCQFVRLSFTFLVMVVAL